MQNVYFDNGATTKVLPQIATAMADAMVNNYGNPSSIYRLGQQGKEVLDDARERVAELLTASPKEIIFTGGGSEGDTMLLRGVAQAFSTKGKHIVTTAVEHHAILHTCQQLEKEGFTVTYLPVDEQGLVAPETVEAALTKETILISVMYANNEIGTIMPIKEIGAIARKHGILFHTDAVQAAGHIPIDVQADNIDLLTLTAHKFHGPKGTGAVYIRQGITLKPLIYGGAQEKGLRAGTENTSGILGLGLACSHAVEHMLENRRKITALRNKLIDGIRSNISGVRLNGHQEQRLPNNVNFSISDIEGETLLLLLDLAGIAASSGSACSAGALDPSHVLLAIGLSPELARGSLRLTLSEFTTEEEVDYLLVELPKIVERLRFSQLGIKKIGKVEKDVKLR
ncbi:MAG TPA: cysteine desulfurase NifS [Candidatus Avacidaminococcus intestinavium]|uniref:Cysteine desulfurase n=1 Tax=Candidatus Avacidaminococcus intestinavium TaxID=2840684 RepID=A0A9D1SLY2_9FIRM|nr:cysteine desulfurase NifS [Candidatus Avacidaminococcus intestinavium]